MKKLFLIILFSCVCLYVQAQLNYVRNPSFEQYSKCPTDWNQMVYATSWSGVGDTIGTPYCAPEYINTCDPGIYATAPNNINFYQYPRSGNGMALTLEYFDESIVPPATYDYHRDYVQGRLFKPLIAGKSYCLVFYVNLIEASQYAINKIGAYFDDGSIDTIRGVDKISKCGQVISSVTPQVFTTTIINDTLNWIKIEGSFMANGTERYITIGNFFDVTDIATIKLPDPKFGPNQYSFYLVDDVSVIETHLDADAGIDKAVHIGDSVWIGRGLDSTKGLDCKWYYKGALADSGAGMYAKAGTVKGIDTYVVVQTICGLVKTDTVLVYTFPVGIDELPDVQAQSYTIYPNPSDGLINIMQKVADAKPVDIVVYSMQGTIVYKLNKQFTANSLQLQLDDVPTGLYLIRLTDCQGQSSGLRFAVQR